jgi:hypothetical protein
MTPEQEQLLLQYNQALQEHSMAIAKILYELSPKEKMTTLAEIEQEVRRGMLEHVMPTVGFFLSKQ